MSQKLPIHLSKGTSHQQNHSVYIRIKISLGAVRRVRHNNKCTTQKTLLARAIDTYYEKRNI